MIALTLLNGTSIHFNIDKIIYIEPYNESTRGSRVWFGTDESEFVPTSDTCEQILNKINDARYTRAYSFGDGLKEGVYGKGKYPGSIRVSCS